MAKANDASRIRDILDSIRQKVGPIRYRKFLVPLHRGITDLLKDPSNFRTYSTTTEQHKAVASKTERAQHLLTLLGYDVDADSMRLPPGRSLPNAWNAFVDASVADLVVSKGDPTALAPLTDDVPVAMLIARLAYHMYVRVQLLAGWTPSHLRRHVFDHVTTSFLAVDETAKRLRLLDPSTPIGVKWETAKVMMQVFFNDDVGGDGVDGNYTAVAKEIESEMKRRVRGNVAAAVFAVVPYMQNMQAVAGNTSTGNMVWPNAVTTYLRNSTALPRGCVSAEYAETMEIVERLMKESQKRTLTEDEIERVHATVVWQTENVMRCFKPEFFESNGAVELVDADSASVTMPRTPAEGKRMLTEALELLEQAVGFFKMRNFVEVIHFAACQVLSSGGSMMDRVINKGDRTFAATTSETDVAMQIVQLLGFSDHDLLPGGMILVDYEANETTLRTFVDIGNESLLLKPVGIPSIRSIDDVVSLVAFLIYTLRIRLRLQCAFTPAHLIFHLRDDVLTAISDVDIALDRLELLPSDSESRAVWTTIKEAIKTFVDSSTSTSTTGYLIQIDAGIDELASRIACEMTERFPTILVDFVGYLQNVAAIVTITRRGEHLNPEGVLIYLNTTEKLVSGTFSDEYMDASRTIRQIMEASLRREFTDDEAIVVFRRTLWQARHFFAHLRADQIDMTACTSELVALARRRGLRLSPSLSADAVPVALQALACDDDESDDDDDEKADKSEKADEGKDSKRVREFLESIVGLDDRSAAAARLRDADFNEDIVEEELTALVSETLTKIDSSRSDLADIDGALTTDDLAPSIKVPLVEKRQLIRKSIETMSSELDTLNQLRSGLRSCPDLELVGLDVSMDDLQLYSTLQDIVLPHKTDVKVLWSLIVSGLDLVPGKTVRNLSEALGMEGESRRDVRLLYQKQIGSID